MRRILLILTLFLTATAATAQPRLELRHLKPNVPDYYYYQLFIAAYCGDSVLYDLQKHQLIYEETNGRIDTNSYTIDRHASPARNSCYELALVFDNSSTITADHLAFAADAGHAYVDTMSRTCQKAAVVSFSDRPTLRTSLTNVGTDLHSSLDGMTPGGRRSLYDGIFLGMVDLATNGIERVKLVIALTTGNDNASSTRMDELIQTARQDDIRIFIIGLGSGIFEDPLREICQRTGGLYYPVADASVLPGMYAGLAGFVQREYDEHRIVRQTRDVIMKDLLIRMRLEACEDSVWTHQLFNPSIPTTVVETVRPLAFRLGQSYPNPVTSGAELRFLFSVDAVDPLPLRLQMFDQLGREVAVVFDRRFPPGEHRVPWSSEGLRPGVYFYRLSSGTRMITGRMTVLP